MMWPFLPEIYTHSIPSLVDDMFIRKAWNDHYLAGWPVSRVVAVPVFPDLPAEDRTKSVPEFAKDPPVRGERFGHQNLCRREANVEISSGRNCREKHCFPLPAL